MPKLKFILPLIAFVFVAVGVAFPQSTYEKLVDAITSSSAEVCISGDPCAESSGASSSASSGPRNGKEVYIVGCATCHDGGIGGAPRLGNRSDWVSLRRVGVDTLVQSVISGKGAMPPKGLCQDCSDEELIDAVEYMLDEI